MGFQGRSATAVLCLSILLVGSIQACVVEQLQNLSGLLVVSQALQADLTPSELFNNTELLTTLLSAHTLPGLIPGSDLVTGATWESLEPGVNVTIPAYPNVVASGSYLTSGYGPPARIIAVHNPSDCESIIYVLLSPTLTTELSIRE
ncbi:hypothetical protein F751_0284 [Auxenochlorella protothecoides]|uniref:FAS1 domain-containing protein n=1 Tax=Auxenochlorella protothecoides TaxID=3075 RepID=A0A087SS39_AUXPR|nr:hypothetical protein F751_0284 [Auxenochlorella protothecoides]KFM28543.1 hypothetical protein F751_0284 [Auxenochlorella protothecoides]